MGASIDKLGFPLHFLAVPYIEKPFWLSKYTFAFVMKNKKGEKVTWYMGNMPKTKQPDFDRNYRKKQISD